MYDVPGGQEIKRSVLFYEIFGKSRGSGRMERGDPNLAPPMTSAIDKNILGW